MTRMNPKIDAYLRADEAWREETKALRTIILGCGLTEELKWGKAGQGERPTVPLH